MYEIGTYLVTAILIWWERERLAEFHIDSLVLGIVILGKPLELLLYWMHIPFTYPPKSAVYFLYLPIALGLSVALLSRRFSLPKHSVRLARWLIVGFLGGIALGVYFGSVIRANNTVQSSPGNVTFESLWVVFPAAGGVR